MTQKELKVKFEEVLKRDVWPKSTDMVTWSVKQVAHIVELANGDFISIDKPTIKKDFCFGYSDSHFDTADYDRANSLASHAAKSEDYFTAANLRDLTEKIEQLKKQKSNQHAPRYEYRLYTPYTGQPADSPYKGIATFDRYDDRQNDSAPIAAADMARIIEGYEVVKAQFEKRLRTYLKRYGLSKVNSWSYWRDA